MNLEKIQENAIKTYAKNLNFLEKNNKNLYEKVRLFSLGLEIGQITPKYELEFKDEGYFDIKDIREDGYIYGSSSLEYSSKLTSIADFYSLNNSFKISFNFRYKSSDLESFLENPIVMSRLSGIAPIISYVNDNLPLKEEMKEIYSFIFFGTGLGFHISSIHKKLKSKVYYIIEPSLEIFRLSLFTTDYTLLSSSTIHFLVALEESVFKKNMIKGIESISLFNHYIKFSRFSDNYNHYIKSIRENFVSRSHYLFSFDRELVFLDRTYRYINSEYKFLGKDYLLNPISETPVLLLAAGPSLHKNIEFIKKNKNNFIIVAALILMPFLEENNISPDFIVQVDGNEEIFTGILDKITDINFFHNTKFLFISNIAEKVLDRFKKENVYLFQAIFTVTDEYLNAKGTSVGEMSYFLILMLGFKKIYLLGLDLALGENKEMHSTAHPLAEKTNNIEFDNESVTFSKSTLEVKGNFKEKVKTLVIFSTCIDTFNGINIKYKKNDVSVYNLSNGAYLNDTIPYDLNKITDLKQIDKEKEIFSLIKSLDSKIINNKLSIDFKNKKIKEYIKLKEKIDNLHLSKKYKNSEEFKKAIISLVSITSNSSSDNDILVKILHNYYKYTLEYIIYFINLKKVNNLKHHIKKLNKYLYIQTNKIFEEYLRILEKNIK